MGKPRTAPPQKPAPAKAPPPRLIARASSASSRQRTKKIAFVAALLLAAALIMRVVGSPATEPAVPHNALPTLDAAESLGARAFSQHCQTCHGSNGAGTRVGPPLVHKIYDPSHHSDRAFVRAVRHGVIAHHWRFGDMPRVPDVTDQELDAIIRFVRAVQRANGIH